MKIIESLQHPLIRQIRAILTNSHQRKKSPFVLLEGEHLCRAYWATGQQPEYLFVDSTRALPAWLQEALHQGLSAERVVGLSPKVLHALEEVSDSQGVLAVIAQPDSESLPERWQQSVLVLDRIQDPGNVGTILRTAVSAGIATVLLLKGCAHVWSPKVLRSAQGAHFALQLVEGADWVSVRPHLPQPLVATHVDSNAQSLFQTELPSICTWVFGHEGQGVTQAILQSVDLKIYIPQQSRQAFDSLNVGVAAGICLFEQLRQHAG